MEASTSSSIALPSYLALIRGILLNNSEPVQGLPQRLELAELVRKAVGCSEHHHKQVSPHVRLLHTYIMVGLLHLNVERMQSDPQGWLLLAPSTSKCIQQCMMHDGLQPYNTNHIGAYFNWHTSTSMINNCGLCVVHISTAHGHLQSMEALHAKSSQQSLDVVCCMTKTGDT